MVEVFLESVVWLKEKFVEKNLIVKVDGHKTQQHKSYKGYRLMGNRPTFFRRTIPNVFQTPGKQIKNRKQQPKTNEHPILVIRLESVCVKWA